MLKTTNLHDQTISWQQQLANLLTDPGELLEILGLNADQLGFSAEALQQFPLRVPRPYLARIKHGDPQDPLLLQVLPQTAELISPAGYSTDPLQESDANPKAGILHKYHGRALLITTQSCAIHCRYCFRRHFPYSDNRPGRQQWLDTLQYIAADPTLNEVILSGGDPLATSNHFMQWLLDALAEIPHLQTLRLHTRLPIMLPDRIDSSLCNMLKRWRGQVVMVIHSNHAQELDTDVDAACQRLRDQGVHLLNQSVLLKGINDSAETLAALSERLFAAGVLPYYLHMLDKVSGAAHFDVSTDIARQLIEDLRGSLPGYLVPRLVREEPGSTAKTPA